MLHHNMETSKVRNVHTFAPTSFSHFKTYDGIETIGGYIIPELFAHLEKLKADHGIVIAKISFIGYSLGGLLARYIVGELYDCGFFSTVNPGFFTTFATPHLGVAFYRYRILNVLGSHLLGQTGRDLFICDGEDSIVYKLSDPTQKYIKGLDLFGSKISIANAKFDRTVGFYSAFMTKYDVFDDWGAVDAEFIEDLPNAVLQESEELIECRVVNFKKSKRLDGATKVVNHAPKKDDNRSLRLFIFFIPGAFFFPIFFSVSLFATIKSYVTNFVLAKPDFSKLWNQTCKKVFDSDPVDTSLIHAPRKSSSDLLLAKDTDNDGYNEEKNMKKPIAGISHLTREVVESGLEILDDEVDGDGVSRTLSIESRHSQLETKKYTIDLDFELDYTSKSSSVKKLLGDIVSDDLSHVPLVKNLTPLPFNATREKILKHLNQLDWTKIAVLLHNLNSHQSVVGRRGFDKTPESIPFLFLYSFLIEYSIKEHCQ